MSFLLIPRWEESRIYQVDKIESFRFGSTKKPDISSSYQFVIAPQGDGVMEAHYPNGILQNIKLIKELDGLPEFKDSTLSNTFYYQRKQSLKNWRALRMKHLIDCLRNDAKRWATLIESNELKEEFWSRVDFVLNSPENMRKHVLSDRLQLHINDNIRIMPDHYWEVNDNSRVKKIFKKLMPKKQWLTSSFHLARHEILNGKLLVEYLKTKENVSTSHDHDLSQIVDQFVCGAFEVKDYPNLTHVHEQYLFDMDNLLLNSYHKHFVVDTGTMNKRMIINCFLYS